MSLIQHLKCSSGFHKKDEIPVMLLIPSNGLTDEESKMYPDIRKSEPDILLFCKECGAELGGRWFRYY